MKHAGPATLVRLAALLDALRGVRGLKERASGTFYRGGRAFLHFHEDPAGDFADVRLDGHTFTRLPVTTTAEQAACLARVRGALGREEPPPC